MSQSQPAGGNPTSSNVTDFASAFKDHGPKSADVIYASRALMWIAVLLAVTTAFLPLLNWYSKKNHLDAAIYLREELIVAALSALFVTLAVSLRTVFHGMRTRLDLEAMKFQAERNSQIHSETIATIKKPPESAPPAPSQSEPMVSDSSPLEWLILLSNRPKS